MHLKLLFSFVFSRAKTTSTILIEFKLRVEGPVSEVNKPITKIDQRDRRLQQKSERA